MHAIAVLQKCLPEALGGMDRRRCRTLLGAVRALLAGRRLVLMELARHWPGAQRVRAPLKRVDRLLGNAHLQGERAGLYRQMSRWLLRGQRPVVLVDWTPLKSDGQWQLLRAAVAVGSRSMTLWEAVYPVRELYSPQVERGFLQQLVRLMPPGCVPIVVSDAGFKTPWFRALRELGWDYVGRLRNPVQVRLQSLQSWQRLRALYPQASARARRIEAVQIAKSRPWGCDLVLYRRRRRGRVALSCFGRRSRRAHSLKQARREGEPWLLATSLREQQASAKQIVNLYARRMQIEQGFRDLKSARFGAAFRYSLTRSSERLQILLLIHALATFLAWLVGLSLAVRTRCAYAAMNAKRTKRHYSTLRLGFEALKDQRPIPAPLLWHLLIDLPPKVLSQMVLSL